MSLAPMRFCAHPGCSTLVRDGRCAKHRPKESDRPNFDVRTWYRGPRWRELRRRVLREEPFCRECATAGRRVATTDIDHITPHRGDPVLFWDRRNLQALCHQHHSAKTGRGE